MKLTTEHLLKLIKEELGHALELISEEDLEEAFKGIPNVITDDGMGLTQVGIAFVNSKLKAKGEPPWDKLPEEEKQKHFQQIKRYFVGRKNRETPFQKKAKKIFSGKVFPNSDLYIVPFIGSEIAAMKKISNAGGKDLSAKRAGQALRVLGGDRFKAFSLDTNVLISLGLPKETVDSMKQNDIVIIPLATTISKDFWPSPHMIFHAIVDSDHIAQHMPETRKFYFFLKNQLGKDDDQFRTIGRTKAFRDGAINGPNDAAAELIVGALLYGYDDIDPAGEWSQYGMKQDKKNNKNPRSWRGDKRGLLPNFTEQVTKVTNEIKEFMPGKIIVISVS